MRRSVVLVGLLSGCGLARTVGAPVSPTANTRDLYPHEIEYELLTQVSGEACAPEGDEATKARSPDPAAVGPGGLWERAKYEAIRSIHDADVLLFAVSKVTTKGETICVSVAGRAARAQTVRAVGSGVREDRRPVPERTKVRKTHGEVLEPGE